MAKRPLGAAPKGLWPFFRQADLVERIMAYAGGKLYQDFTAVLTGLSATVRGYAEVAQDAFWFVNGVDTPRVTDGVTVTRIGTGAPAAAPVVALVVAAGNLPAEDHFYRYTYVREEAAIKVRESNPSPESIKVTNTAGSARNNVTVIASAATEVTHIYIYRRSSISVVEHKFVLKTTNVGAVVEDNIAVSALGGFGFWEPAGGTEDHAFPPDDLFALTLHRDGRFYAWAGGSRLHYSRPLAFHNWPGAKDGRKGVQLFINTDDGDKGQQIISESDDVLLLKRFNVYRLLGDGPSADDGTLGAWRVEKVPTRFGCAARASAARGYAGTFWMSDDGPVRVDPRSGIPMLIGERIRPWFEASPDLTAAVGIVWKTYYLLFLPFGAKWEGMVYDVRKPTAWWPFTEMDAQALTVIQDGRLLWAGVLESDKPDEGIIYEFDGHTSDNGAVVTAELTTAVIDPAVGSHKLFAAEFDYRAQPGHRLTLQMRPDQTRTFVEREVKLTGPILSRQKEYVHGTKRLQGKVLQLYVKSVNALKRPGIYHWAPRGLLLNREVGQLVFTSEVFTDPDPDWGPLTVDQWDIDPYCEVT